MMALDEKTGGHQRDVAVHPEGNMNVCTKFHNIPSNSI